MPNPLAPLYSFDFVLLLACAVFYYKAAEIENVSGVWWAAISVVLFLFTWRILGWGLLGNFLGQAGLLGGITLVRALLDNQKNP